jgi:hypothetical protein
MMPIQQLAANHAQLFRGMETGQVFGAMPIWRHAVGWLELAKPSF